MSLVYYFNSEIRNYVQKWQNRFIFMFTVANIESEMYMYYSTFYKCSHNQNYS